MSAAWKNVGASYLAAGVHIVDEECDGIYRATLADPVAEVSITNKHEARQRLAEKLERIAADLRGGR